MKLRAITVRLHRWAGLTMAGFLVIVGLTGSLLAFNGELERVFAPQLFARTRPDTPRLSLSDLATRAAALIPQARVVGVTYTEPDQASIYFEPKDRRQDQAKADLGFDEFFVDPWTGAELGRRRNGDLSEGMINFMPFIYRIHWTLAIGSVGQWLLGITALVWTIDSLLAIYLTFPGSGSLFWRGWARAWTVKRHTNFFRLNFDLHRAGGLWLLPLLLIFAWSSVMMNIRPVYEAAMRTVFDYRSPLAVYNERAGLAPTHEPALDWQKAEAIGQLLMSEQAAARRFQVGEPQTLSYASTINAYAYEVRGSRDLFERSPKGGATTVLFDGDTGALIELSEPTGERAGNTIESWLYALHMARVFGMTYRLVVCGFGLCVVGLSATGIYIWLRKRKARSLAQTRQRATAEALRS